MGSCFLCVVENRVVENKSVRGRAKAGNTYRFFHPFSVHIETCKAGNTCQHMWQSMMDNQMVQYNLRLQMFSTQFNPPK